MSALNILELNIPSKELPELIMLVGIPASGKSTTTEHYAKLGYLILSSDSIRLALLEAETEYPHDQKEVDKLNVRVFETIRNRAVAALKAGRSVVIDATNLSRKRRIAFLSNLGRIKCFKKCVLFITPAVKKKMLCANSDNALVKRFSGALVKHGVTEGAQT